MTIPLIGIVASSVGIALLTLLFRFEKSRGRRVIESARLAFDILIENIEGVFQVFFQHIGRDLLRQLVHYSFHAVLTVLLYMLKKCEVHIGRMLRSNYTLAHRTRRERTTENKLDKIAEHKATVALSEEE